MIYSTTAELLITLGKNLKALRLAQNLSQQMAAERSGISLKAVRNIEGGNSATTESLLLYCRTLGKIDWLMTLAPSTIDASAFERVDAKPRQRARNVRKVSAHE